MLNQKQQGRLDGFFKVTPKDKPATSSAKNAKDTKKPAGKRKVGCHLATLIRFSADFGLFLTLLRLTRRKSLEQRRRRARSRREQMSRNELDKSIETWMFDDLELLSLCDVVENCMLSSDRQRRFAVVGI